MNWEDDAACRTLPTSIFYAERGQNQDVAKKVCFGCPVQTECLRENLGQLYGVFGGTSPVDRVLLRAILDGREVTHGRRGWKLGCRCDRCVNAHDKELGYQHTRKLFDRLKAS